MKILSSLNPRPAEEQTIPPGLAADLAAIYNVPVPARVFRTPQRAAEPPRRVLPRWAAFAAAAAIAAVVVAFAAVRPFSAEQVNAAELLERTQAVAAQQTGSGGAYHMVAVNETIDPSGAHVSVVTTETWRRDDHHMKVEMRERRDGTDGLLMAFVRDGDSITWWATGDDGEVRAVRGAASELAQLFADPYAGNGTLAATIASFRSECQVAAVDGEAAVGGREAYVVRVTPDAGACGNEVKGRAIAEERGQLTVWVDKETSRPLRMETGPEGGPALFRYEVQAIDEGIAAASAYSAGVPEGVVVVDVSSYSEAKSRVFGLGWTEPAPGGGSECPVEEPSKPNC